MLAALLLTAALPQLNLHVDASRAPLQSVFRVTERFPVRPGPLTLLYPKWIIDEFGPTGPVVNLADVHVTTPSGTALPWRREPHDIYALDVTVPKGTTTLDVAFSYLGAPNARVATTNMFALHWTNVLLYPSNFTNDGSTIAPALTLPGADWKVATALPKMQRSGNTVRWAPVTMRRLIDSPLDGCTHFKAFDLGRFGTGDVALDACADNDAQLQATPEFLGKLKAVVGEIRALFRVRHWDNYTFLLTVSDQFAGFGIEHQDSSDNGVAGDYLTTDRPFNDNARLLGHEFIHSWNGRYRIPRGLYVKNLNTPYDDSLLWVYEGLTQYYASVIAFRAGTLPAADWPDYVASTYAQYDNEPGKWWRPLEDTAVSAQVLYPAPELYEDERRGTDFYRESELLWLKVDSIIRAQTHDRKTIDDFTRAFFGGRNTSVIQAPYTRADLIATLDRVAKYDWTSFFDEYVDGLPPHPPNGFNAEGWRLVYTDQPTDDAQFFEFRYSLGMQTRLNATGEILDVDFGSPAWAAGLGIDTFIQKVDGKPFSPQAVFDAIVGAQKTREPIQMIVEKDGAVRTVLIPYYGGVRYPHLVRIPETPDWLSDVIRPRRETR